MPTDATPSESSPNKPAGSGAGSSKSGHLVVLVMIAAGLIAATGTYLYWSSQTHIAEVKVPSKDDTLDPARQAERFAQLEMSINKAMEGELIPPDKLGEVEVFVKDNPEHVDALRLLGKAYLKNDSLKKAYELFVRCLKLDSQQADVHLVAGTIAMTTLDDIDAAEKHYRDAIEVDAYEPHAHVHLATVHVRRRKFEEARDALLQALRLDSEMHEAYWRLSEVFAKQNKLVAALTQIDKAIEYVPEKDRDIAVQYIRYKANLLRRDNKPGDAMHTLVYSLTAEEQAWPDVIADMALCLSSQGKFSQAAVLFERQLKREPLEWRHAADAARWRIKAGEKEAAQKMVEVIRRIDPRQPVIKELEDQLKG